MIFGIGTDIVDINRIKKMESLDTFAKKILSEKELLIFNDLKEVKKSHICLNNLQVRKLSQKLLALEFLEV